MKKKELKPKETKNVTGGQTGSLHLYDLVMR